MLRNIMAEVIDANLANGLLNLENPRVKVNLSVKRPLLPTVVFLDNDWFK